jgi:hypothetical protein
MSPLRLELFGIVHGDLLQESKCIGVEDRSADEKKFFCFYVLHGGFFLTR